MTETNTKTMNEVKQINDIIKDTDKNKINSPGENWESLCAISDEVNDIAEDDSLNHHIDTADEALDLLTQDGIDPDSPYLTNAGIDKGSYFHALDVLYNDFDGDDMVESPRYKMDYRPLSYETVTKIAKDIKQKLMK